MHSKQKPLSYLPVFANMQQLINVTTNLVATFNQLKGSVTMTVTTKFIVTAVRTKLVITAVMMKLVLTAVTPKLVVSASVVTSNQLG